MSHRHLSCACLSFCLRSFAFVAAPAVAQSPNTASMIVIVVDQTGAVVPDAKVSVVNAATGAAARSCLGQRRQRHHSGTVADRNLYGQRVQRRIRQRRAQGHRAALGRNGDTEGEAARRF